MIHRYINLQYVYPVLHNYDCNDTHSLSMSINNLDKVFRLHGKRDLETAYEGIPISTVVVLSEQNCAWQITSVVLQRVQLVKGLIYWLLEQMAANSKSARQTPSASWAPFRSTEDISSSSGGMKGTSPNRGTNLKMRPILLLLRIIVKMESLRKTTVAFVGIMYPMEPHCFA